MLKGYGRRRTILGDVWLFCEGCRIIDRAGHALAHSGWVGKLWRKPQL